LKEEFSLKKNQLLGQCGAGSPVLREGAQEGRGAGGEGFLTSAEGRLRRGEQAVKERGNRCLERRAGERDSLQKRRMVIKGQDRGAKKKGVHTELRSLISRVKKRWFIASQL